MEDSTGKKPFSLEVHWNSRLAMLSDSSWQKSLTQKERGQLKMLADKMGSQTREVIAYAVKNWSQFAEKSAGQCGLVTYPTQPHIGFLLAHHHVAMNMMHSAAMHEKKKAEAKAVAELETQEPKPVPKPKEVPMTPEEKAKACKEFLEWQENIDKQVPSQKQLPLGEGYADVVL
jgi:hypothetical protein